MEMLNEGIMDSLQAAAKNDDREMMAAIISHMQYKQKDCMREVAHKIVIIGDVKMSQQQAIGYAKSVGIEKSRLVFETDYSKFKRLNISKYQYNDDYDLILVGAVPHSTTDKGYYSSIITRMETEDGFPRVIRMGTNQLKVTLSNFKQAINEYIESGHSVAA